MTNDLTIFCEYHIQTKENPKGTDCAAHLVEGRCFKCPYTLEDIQFGIVFGNEPRPYISKTEDNLIEGACQDFKPIDGISEGLIGKLK